MKHLAKGGYRKDLNQYFRSKMEANICRYYNFVKVKWIYEPKEFSFDNIKRGNRYYKPDLYMPIADIWIEVKGYFRASDKTKIRRFKKYYPNEFAKLRFIVPDKYSRSKANGEIMKFLLGDLKVNFHGIISYKEMERYKAFIPEWE